jgi:DNA-binding XRE family transcriptional regulator
MSTKKEAMVSAKVLLEEINGGPLTLGDVLNSTRLCDEVTQAEFAKRLGISRQQLCDIEKGRRVVSPKLAALYAKKLSGSERLFVQLALQDELRRAGLHYEIEIRKAA